MTQELLIKKIKHGSEIKIYFNNTGTEAGLQKAKKWLYEQVGESYSFQDFAAFVSRLVNLVFPKVPVISNNPELEHCAEISAKGEDIYLTGKLNTFSKNLLPSIPKRDNVQPQALLDYCIKDKNWKLMAKFNIK